MAGNPNWGKGVSGNPGGRPRDPLPKLIKAATKDGDKLVKKAMVLLNSKNEDIQMKALSWLSDRGWGKPAQSVDLSNTSGEPFVVKVINFGNSPSA